ncbi:MAG: 2-polyprenyl-3-methyl-6-methoxy-1,4-benzoquinone monooxygenase [Azoarcus sp.]|jgi:ubiquinone biosynthesis monooxygenase Coq7|nr:2-polyprenyl-3-methyl-6-methoxy-1,4-benzoquinone monooxygenase [Azoarcus sp.]
MIDRAILGFDRALRTVFAPARASRPLPGGDLPGAEPDVPIHAHDPATQRGGRHAPPASDYPEGGGSRPGIVFDEAQKRHAAALMRVNHCGEVCAQALYQGQAAILRNASIRAALERASDEETDHLAWTAQRINELGGRKSFLNPLWYGGALAIGVLAGGFGERWNLGFLAETERQVEAHLRGHLDALPVGDDRSRAIIRQMARDEARHAETAVDLGARELPMPVRLAMKLAAKLMTTVAYRL